MTYLRITLRGFVIVSLMASNTVQIAGQHVVGAFVVGFAISAVWWSNAHAAKLDAPYAPVAYGVGAALGTVSGMAFTAWWYA